MERARVGSGSGDAGSGRVGFRRCRLGSGRVQEMQARVGSGSGDAGSGQVGFRRCRLGSGQVDKMDCWIAG